MTWFVMLGKQVCGPLSATQLKQWAANGTVTPNTWIRQGNTGDWNLAANHREIFAQLWGAPSLIPPPVVACVRLSAQSRRAAPIPYRSIRPWLEPPLLLAVVAGFGCVALAGFWWWLSASDRFALYFAVGFLHMVVIVWSEWRELWRIHGAGKLDEYLGVMNSGAPPFVPFWFSLRKGVASAIGWPLYWLMVLVFLPPWRPRDNR